MSMYDIAVLRLYIPYCRYSDIDDDALDEVVKDIKKQHPACGEKMMRGHLVSRQLHIQRRRLRESMKRVCSEEINDRRLITIQRRQYTVPSPNFLWHLDGTHKLVRWKLVVHAGIDGFSRLILYCHCSPNNKAATVLHLFQEAEHRHGLPLKIRTDQGGENVLVWNYMLQKRLNRSAVLIGSSVHNQRIERLNRDINTQVVNYYANLFTHLEERELLDPENRTDLYCLHEAFLPVINNKLHQFVEGWNNHPLSTEQNYTPWQLHLLNLRQLQLQALDPRGSIENGDIPQTTAVSTVTVEPPPSPLSVSEHDQLLHLISTSSDLHEVALFKVVSEYVGDCIERRVQ